MKKSLLAILALFPLLASAANKYDNPDTIIVSRDGTGQFRNIAEAIDVCRAFMEYHKVIFVKKGVYKEKLTIPHYLTNIEICGEDREQTIITYDDHANIVCPGETKGMGTFRTWTLRIDGSDITLKDITIENNSARLGQAVALHTTGDRIRVIGCRLLGHQDTLFTGTAGTHLLFKNCYINGTTDFIFGPSTAWFEECLIECKADSYITAANTPKEQTYGFIFNNCTVKSIGAEKCYLGRPWRPYAHTVFMNCKLGSHIRPEGWENWRNPENEKTARYYEYNNSGEGAKTDGRVAWSHQLTKQEAKQLTMKNVIGWEE
ncbi:MAG: pectin esterase [Bacteroidaceae bacterium]|nr:pectin esterase [Bacteroidaceae bacterium]